MDKKREVLPDVLKGFAIILVVLGHCIQEGSGLVFSEETLYFKDKIYQLIYSFHMPLFMIISGYFAWSGILRAECWEERRALLKRRCSFLLVPIIGWAVFDNAYALVINLIKGYHQTATEILLKIIVSILTNLWFLWAVLLGFLLVYFMHYFLKDSIPVYVFVFLLMFLTPDGMGLGVYKYMTPYYLLGFYYHKYEDQIKRAAYSQYIYEENCFQRSMVVGGLGVVFAVLFLFFSEEHFIYLTGYKLLGKDILRQIGIDAYRFFIGLIGSLFFILLWRELIRFISQRLVSILSYLGRKSLAIYILSGYVIMYLIRPLAAEWAPNYGINLLENVIVLILSIGIAFLMQKVRYLRRLIGE